MADRPSRTHWMRFGLGFALALGCRSALPEHARPKVLEADQARLAAGDMIRYRALTRADFQGAAMPPQFGDDSSRLAAATCAFRVPGLNVRAPALDDALVETAAVTG